MFEAFICMFVFVLNNNLNFNNESNSFQTAEQKKYKNIYNH